MADADQCRAWATSSSEDAPAAALCCTRYTWQPIFRNLGYKLLSAKSLTAAMGWLVVLAPISSPLTLCSFAPQAPLQPLQDNLENSTYETFERDTIKYTKYEEAIRQALCDMAPTAEVVVIMVVGAGRGPLVRASLQVGRA